MPNSPGDPQSSLKAGEFAKSQHIDIIAIGTDDADQTFLKELASRSELGIKVSRENLEQIITSSVKLLSGNRLPEIKSEITMAEFKDYYDILGVSPKATPDEITKLGKTNIGFYQLIEWRARPKQRKGVRKKN